MGKKFVLFSFLAFCILYIFLRPTMILNGLYFDYRPLEHSTREPFSDYIEATIYLYIIFVIFYFVIKRDIENFDIKLKNFVPRTVRPFEAISIIFTSLISYPFIAYASFIISMCGLFCFKKSYFLKAFLSLIVIFFFIQYRR